MNLKVIEREPRNTAALQLLNECIETVTEHDSIEELIILYLKDGKVCRGATGIKNVPQMIGHLTLLINDLINRTKISDD